MTTDVETIMAEASEIKDPAVAVHLARIEGKMEGMKVSSDALGKQLEQVVSELKEVAKVTSRQSANEDAVRRIWEEIDKRDQKWDERFTKLDARHDVTKDKVNKIFWFSSGVSAVATLLLVTLLWVVQQEMKKTERHDVRLDSIEIHMASDPMRPYRPR